MASIGNIVATLQLNAQEFRRDVQQAAGEIDRINDAASTVATVGVAAFAALGAAVAGVGIAAVAMAAEFEEGAAKLQAATGATTEEMEGFKDAADNMFGNARGSYEEIFGALTTVRQQLGQTGEEAEKTADMALSMSKAFGWDVNESIRAVSATQAAWGATSEESFDMFAALTQQAGDKADDLLDTFNEYSPVLAEVGWEMEDVGQAMARGMQNGAYNYDVMADALKEFRVLTMDGNDNTKEWAATLLGGKAEADKFFKGIADGSLSGSDAVGMITDKIAAMDDKNLQMQAGVAMFGTKWEDASAETILAMGGMNEGLGNIEGSAARAAAAMDDTLGHKVEKIKNGFLLMAKDIGDQLLPTLKRFADFIIANMPAIQATAENVFSAITTGINFAIDAFKAIAGFVTEHKDTLIALAAVITGVVLPSLLGWATQMTVVKAKALAGLIASTARAIAMNYALGLSFLAANAPLLLIIAGIALLVAAVYMIIKHWDTVKAVTETVWNAIKDFLGVVWDGIVAAAKVVWEGLKTFFVGLWDGIKAMFSAAWEGIKTAVMFVIDAFVAGIKLIWEGLKLYFTTVFNVYKTIFTTVWNAIKTAVMAVVNGFVVVLKAVWEALKTYFTTVLNAYKTAFTTIWNAIKTVVTTVFNGIKSVITTVLNAIKTTITTVWNAIKSVITTVLNGIKSVMTSVWNAIKSVVSNAINGVKSVVTSGFNAAKNTATSIFNALKSTITNVWNGIKSATSGAINGVKSTVSGGANFIKSTFTGAVNAVKSAFSGLWSSIRQSLTNVVNGIKEKAGQAKEYLQALNPFKRNSPSLVDNVINGTAVIKSTYEDLSGINLAPPSIGSITAGRIDVEKALHGSGTGGGGGTNYNAPIVQVENMNVRDEQDIRRVSSELYNLQRSSERAKGGK